MKITLYGRIPSKKNSKIWTGKILIPSKKYREREKSQIVFLEKEGISKEKFGSVVSVYYKFRGPDRRKRDLSNKIESINDLFVKYGLLEDDNINIITHIGATYMGIDRENPRVEIDIVR